jgi:integrase
MLPRTKNGGYRDVPVPNWMMRTLIAPRLSPTRTAIFQGPTGRPWAYPTEWTRWRDTRINMATAGLPLHLTHHCLRHSVAIWLKSAGLNPEKIDLMLGHEDGKSTSRRYNQLTSRDRDHIREIMTQLVPQSSWPGPVIE